MAAAVEELVPARPQPRHDVLEVGHRARRAAEHGRVERAAASGEQREAGEAAAGLEAQVGDVFVRDVVARDVEERTEEQSRRPGADERAGHSADRDVERDDHVTIIAYASRMSFLDRLRSMFSGPARTESAAGTEGESIDEARIDAGGSGALGFTGEPDSHASPADELAESEPESE